MDIKYAKYTERIRQKLAFWLQMKKQPKDSLGLQFLNFFGLQLDDIEYILEYAYKQTKIMTADTTFIDIVYKAMLPTYYNLDDIKLITTKGFILNRKKKLYDFFGLEYNYKLLDQDLNNPDYYFLDEDAKYMSAKYNFKITSFGKNIKCGFPVKALEKYLYIFNNESIELVKENSNKDKVIQLIESINLDEISPKEAYMLLVKLKELISE